MERQQPRDLYVLVADQDMLQTMEGLLSRGPSLGIRPIRYAIARHFTAIQGVEPALLNICEPIFPDTSMRWWYSTEMVAEIPPHARRFNTQSSVTWR